MLFLTRHEDYAVTGLHRTTAHSVPLGAACGFYADQPDPDWNETPFGPFAYMFDVPPHAAEQADRTNDISLARTAQEGDMANSAARLTLAPADVAFCRFIEHDILAAVERHTTLTLPGPTPVLPLPRIMVLGTLANLRTGRLDLDSVYGGAAVQGAFAASVTRDWLRDPRRPARLRLGETFMSGDGMLRLGPLADSGALSDCRLADLPCALRGVFVTGDDGSGSPDALNRQRAILGDARNGDDAAVCRLHVALARLHNVAVDAAPDPDDFVTARRLVRWQYQWLMVNDLAPRLCCGATLARVIADGAPVFGALLTQTNGASRARMPLPLEFCGAVMRLLCDGGFLTPRMLRRDRRLNLPSGRACRAGMGLRAIAMPTQTSDDGDMPLVASLLREALDFGGGRRLGPMGTRILAETLVGLVIHDPDSYWNASGYAPGEWHPRDGVCPAGQVIGTVAALHSALDDIAADQSVKEP